tara:strand:- start:266 stop:511 length:246 start_codon:yes stop_codon:yes gene_type:complete
MAEFLMSADDFEDYVLSFYGSLGYDGTAPLYPFNCSDDTIRSAISLVVTAGMNNETFAADSIDREKVRTVLETLGYKEITT